MLPESGPLLQIRRHASREIDFSTTAGRGTGPLVETMLPLAFQPNRREAGSLSVGARFDKLFRQFPRAREQNLVASVHLQ
jgi:hypothetical protein